MISTAGSSFDTLLAVYGDYPGSPDVHINDDVTTSPCAGANQPTALSSAVIFVPQEGKTYWIMLDGSLRTKNLFLPGRDKLVRQYSGDYVLTVDYSTLNIVSTCADVGTCSDVSNSAKVSGQIHLSNYGQAMTGPLSLQLYAINGNSRTMGSSFPDTKTVPLQSILVPRAISPGESLDISYANVCFPGPGPDVSPGGGSSVGWSVYAVLLEFLGGAWQPVDSSLLVYGKWPVVQPFGGPNGGVIRSDPPSPVPKGLRQITLVAPTLMCEDRSDRVSAKAVFADLSELPVEPEWSVEGPIRLDASVSAANPTASALQLSSDADAKISAKLRFAGKIFSATSQLRVLNQCGSVREIKRIKDDIRMEIATADSRQLTIMQTTSLTPPIHWAAVKNLPVYDRGVWRVTNSLPDIRGKVFYQVHWNP
ncbi:MAG: hypothetical protein HYR88_12120 [Verrucomicrobia bacterium]|nr:hypothetical protein [Verrucomicrobiota bacterium]